VRCVPQPIAVERDSGCAIYEYIEGKKISPRETTEFDIDRAVEFLARLHVLKKSKNSELIPPASEACFSVQAIVKNIELRLDRLFGLRNGGSLYSELGEFLEHKFIPSFNEITRWCKSTLNQSRMSFVAGVPNEARTLSPSDFGFHNALRSSGEQIVFLDFEYFGWDDPAKMISDFILHPAMNLKESLKRRFVASVLNSFEKHQRLLKRVEIVYPLFGLKWCLILLNEYVPEYLLRRGFANRSDLNSADLQAKQLTKAKYMCQRIMGEYEHFPYRG